MHEEYENLINQVASGDTESANQTFADLFMNKVADRLEDFKRDVAATFLAPTEESIKQPDPIEEDIKKGLFHKWLGKPEDEPITDADIKKGLKAGGHAAKMANFARNMNPQKFESLEYYEGDELNEGPSRKDFQQVADIIKHIEDPVKRQEAANYHAGIFAQQNKHFNHDKFHAACGTERFKGNPI